MTVSATSMMLGYFREEGWLIFIEIAVANYLARNLCGRGLPHRFRFRKVFRVQSSENNPRLFVGPKFRLMEGFGIRGFQQADHLQVAPAFVEAFDAGLLLEL